MVRGRLPGTVIGQVFRPGTSAPRDFPRYVGLVAKGLDIKLFRDSPITRAAVTGEILPFSGTTYTAPLAHPAIPDRNRSRLYVSDGRTISVARWYFQESVTGSNVWDQVVIDPVLFSSTTTYYFDYVANDPTLLDEVPVDELREVLALGDNQGQIKYREGIDFRFTTTATGPNPGANNQNPTQRAVTAIVPKASNTGTGVITHNSNTYTHDYNRAYSLRCSAAAGVTPTRTATLIVEVLPTSSGAGAAIGRSVTQSNEITILLSEAVPASLTNVLIEYGITLDFVFGLTNFVVTDTFSFNGDGPGLVELDDSLTNTNQFVQTSAVTAVATGEGEITVNPQSVYSGAANQTYELEVTAASGAGNTRLASFRWRTNPKIKVSAGSVTATNGSATVVGVGTSFNTEYQTNDYIFIGNDVLPVKVLSVTNATTMVLTATYPFTTQAGAKALRVRESTGLLTNVAVTAPSRVTLDQGVYLDFDFGPTNPDNFDIGDTFSFTASVSRKDYNGKENRNYDLTVTATSVNHQVTMSYVSNTAGGGFGSHAFSEGAPLVLSNNLILHARNISLANRFDATAPADTFDLSLTFDGLIDWTLEAELTETVALADVLRDLTGSVTGVVGSGADQREHRLQSGRRHHGCLLPDEPRCESVGEVPLQGP